MNMPDRHDVVILAAMVMGLAGCAVLTIDVDVYKGPLANEMDVQIEQVIARAVGAKPLLARLRNELENTYRKNLSTHDRDQFHIEDLVEKESWFRKGDDGYVAPDYGRLEQGSDRDRKRPFYDPGASHLNDVLSLYEDTREPLASIRSELDSVVPALRTAAATFQRDSSAEFKAWTAKPVSCEKTQLFCDNLREAYQQLLTSPDDPSRLKAVGKILKFHRDLQAAFAESEPQLKPLPEFTPTPSSDPYANIITPIFNALATRRIVVAHASLIIAEAEDRAAFTDRVIETAAAFLDASESLGRWWQATVSAIGLLSDSPTIRNGHGLPTPSSITALAKILSQNTAPRFLHCAIAKGASQQASWAGHLVLAYKDTTIESGKTVDPCSMDFKAYRKDVDAKLAQRNLASLLIKDPQTTAAALLAANNFTLNSADVIPDKYRRAYGLVFIPGVAGAQDVSSFNLPDVTSAAQALPASQLFGGGRLPDGLDRLTERYLKSVPHSRDREEAQQLLLSSLIAYGEKLTTTANYIRMIPHEDPSHWYAWLWPPNKIMAHEECLRLFLIFPASGGCWADSTDQYMRVLQAVGNSITFQVNDIRKALAYRHAPCQESPAASAPQKLCLKPYIRTTSTYLRSSIPATNLQSDPKNLSANMLDEITDSVMQIIGLVARLEKPSNHVLLEELDKQAWQSINRIKVRGAGFTNYVVAKDDIGNWYVKNFESDPEKIIQSAKNLALFAASGGGASLGKSVMGGPADATPQERTTASEPVTGLLDADRAKYEKELEGYAAKLAKDSRSLKDRIVGVWQQGDPSEALTQPDIDALTSHILDKAPFAATPDKSPESLQKALQDIEAAGAHLLPQFDKKDSSGVADGEVRLRAKALAAKTIRAFLNDSIDAQETIVTRHRQRLSVLASF